jgi:hypothetical protein
MRKRFFLTGAFVCLLVANFALGQTPGLNSFSSTEAETAIAVKESSASNTFSSAEVASKLVEAKRLLQSTSFAGEKTGSAPVALAAIDPATSEIQIVSIAKDSFLTKDGVFLLSTQAGKSVRLRIVRPNGVNTAVTVTDTKGHSLLPLLVQYPIVRNGSWSENAYYTSAHPALLSSGIVDEGQRYLASMFSQATQELQSTGVAIPADIVEVAKHLVIVEHTDHKRFRDDERANIYPEVLALYALNQGNTFRYSVSSAGAGGMIQMIPRTYEAIRRQHPKVSLEADFVRGMQNHANALKAQLLYINDTWNYLRQSADVQQAMSSGFATKTELLAAGYNSNPYRLPNYLANGGTAWKTLIPAETQMYLAIYQSVDSHVDFQSTESIPTTDVGRETASTPGPSIARQATSALMSWVGKQVVANAVALTHLVR